MTQPAEIPVQASWVRPVTAELIEDQVYLIRPERRNYPPSTYTAVYRKGRFRCGMTSYSPLEVEWCLLFSELTKGLP